MPLPGDRSYFTVEARVALIIAQKHAQEQGVGTLDVGHLLLALLDPPGDPLQRELRQLDLPTADLAAALRTLLPPAETPWNGEITLAEATKAVIERAVGEVQRSTAARTDGSRLIDDRHLFLGIVQRSDIPIVIKLREQGFALEALRDPVRALRPRPHRYRFGEWITVNRVPFAIVICCMASVVGLAAPLPTFLDAALLPVLACGVWLLLYAFIDRGAAMERYAAGERSIRESGRLRLGPRFSLALVLSCTIPILLVMVLYYYGFAP